ncbi:MAG: YCF48-related protein [Candidatus Kapabacteria bacterium]|nr:YCF48-related protein [Candidatus Kapabacteria bacterium]
MRTIIILAILLNNIYDLAAGRWITIDSNYTNIFRAIECNNPNTCITIANLGGWGAFIRKTTDGGNQWSVLYDNSKEIMGLRLNDLACPNEDLFLVACNNGKVLRTTNGGNSWDTIKLSINNNLVRIFMMSDSFGCLLSNPNGSDYFVTKNNGQSWEHQRLSDSISGYVMDVFITKDTVFFLLLNTSEGRFFVRYDYKTGEEYLFKCPDGINNIFFNDSNIGWGFGNFWSGSTVFSCIYKTTDGGTSWQTQIEKPGYTIYDIKFFDENSGIAVGDNQTVLRTTDGGGSWLSDSTYPPYANPLVYLKVAIPSRTRQYLIAHQGVVKRYDETTSFDNENINNSESLIIYPNPINKDLCKFNLSLSTEFVDLEYVLYNSLGLNFNNYIKSVEHHYSDKLEFELLNSIPSGIYFIILKAGQKKYINKVIIY